MKDVIVVSVILPFLLFFILQLGLEHSNYTAFAAVNGMVQTSVDQAKQDGYFTNENIEALKTDISKRLKISKDRIIVIADADPKYRTNEYNASEMMQYQVKVPIDKLIVANEFFGISDEDNKGVHIVEGSVMSERLMP